MFSPSSSAHSNTVSPSAPLARRTLLLGGLAVLTAGCAARVHPLSEEAKRKLPTASPSASASASPAASASASPAASTSTPPSSAATNDATNGTNDANADAPRVPESEDALIKGWEKYPGPLKLTGQYTGEYQPATSSAPAQNVPKPLKTVPHRDEPTFEGAYETLRAYYSALITTLKDGHYASQAVELIHPEDRSAIAEINAVKELYEQKGWYMEFTCSISMQKTEPVGALKDGDGYVVIYVDAEYSATAVHQPDGTERKVPAITQNSTPHVMLFAEGKWWRISVPYMNERLGTGSDSSGSSGDSHGPAGV